MHVDQIRVYQSGRRPRQHLRVEDGALPASSASSSATHWVCSDDPAAIGKSGEYLCDDKTSDMNTPFIPDTPWFEDMPAVYEGINMLRVWVSIDGYAPEGSTICIDAFEITGSSCQSPSMPPPSPPAPPTPPPMGCNGGWQDGSLCRRAGLPASVHRNRGGVLRPAMAAYPDAKYITWQGVFTADCGAHRRPGETPTRRSPYRACEVVTFVPPSPPPPLLPPKSPPPLPPP